MDQVIWPRQHRCKRYFGGKESRTGSEMVPLDMVLLSFYRLAVINILLWLQFAMQVLTGGSDPKI